MRSRAGLALAVLFAFNLLNFYDRQVLASVNEPIRKEWGLSDTQLGALGTAFTLLYAFVGVPLGRLADRGSRKMLLSLGLLVWSALTAVQGAAAGFWSLFAARLGVGVGEAVCAPASTSLIGDLYPASRRSWALSIFMLGLPVGQLLSYLISGYAAQAWGWRSVFLIAGVPGCLLALAAPWLIADPARGAAETVQVGARARSGSPYLLILSIPTMWWIILSGALHNYNMYAFSGFLPAFLIRTHRLGLGRAGVVSGLLKGAAGGIGLFAVAHLADRLHRTRPNGRLWLATLCMFGTIPFMLIALGQPDGSPWRFLLWMAPASMLMYTYYSTVYSSIQDIVEPSLRGTAMAVYFFAMYVMGASFGPLGTGALSDWLARQAAAGGPVTEQFRAIGLHRAMYVLPVLELFLGLVLWAGSRTVARDRQKLDTWMRAAAAEGSANA